MYIVCKIQLSHRLIENKNSYHLISLFSLCGPEHSVISTPVLTRNYEYLTEFECDLFYSVQCLKWANICNVL
jgi:hypothetical protein